MGNSEEQKSPFGKDGMFNEAHHLLFARAKELRNTMTDAESIIWSQVKQGIEGYKFRRQHPIGIYIVDFYCHKVKLVVEIDGSIHNDPIIQEQDKMRQKDLEDWGYRVIRFTNEEVLKSLETVISAIRKNVSEIKDRQTI